MTDDNAISTHYIHGNLLTAIENSIAKLGKTIAEITIDDLGPIDEFHIGGRQATEHLLDQLKFSTQQHILDIGCGLGGAARFAVDKYACRVSGIDLTREYIEIGNTLCSWVKLDKHILLEYGNATAMPFADNNFDGAYMLHVGMNIEDKPLLFQEIHRVLRPGAFFGLYDIMRDVDGELFYPVPWATDPETSHLATPHEYKTSLENAGFNIVGEHNRRQFAVDFFNKLQKQAMKNGGPPPLGLHILMQESTAGKIANVIRNIEAGYIVPVEIIAQKI